MNVEWRQAAADPRPSQTTWAVSPPVQAARNYTHHRHFLLLSPKADTHFTVHNDCKKMQSTYKHLNSSPIVQVFFRRLAFIPGVMITTIL